MNIYMVSDEDRAELLSMLPADVAEEDPVLLCAARNEEGEVRPMGVLAATIISNTWHLSYVAVEKEFRRQGIGRALVSSLIDMARGALADGISLEYHLDPDADCAADLFFDALGFREILRSNVYCIPILSIGEGLKSSVKKRPKGHFSSLAEIPARRWEELRRKLIVSGEAYSASPDTPVFEQRVFIDPGQRGLYDEEISSVLLTDSGSVGGCILISRRDEGIVVDYLCSMTNETESVKGLAGILCISYVKALKKYGDDCLIFVNTQNTMSKQLFLKLAGGNEKLYGVAVEREIIL